MTYYCGACVHRVTVDDDCCLSPLPQHWLALPPAPFYVCPCHTVSFTVDHRRTTVTVDGIERAVLDLDA